MKFIAHRYTIRQNLLSIFCFCLSIYFTYHAAFGTRSYFQLLTLERETVHPRLGIPLRVFETTPRTA